MIPVQEYAAIFAGAGTNPGEKTLEDKFFEKEVQFLTSDNLKLLPSFLTIMLQQTDLSYPIALANKITQLSYCTTMDPSTSLKCVHLCSTGGDQCTVIHAAVSLWSVLLVHSS